MGLTTVEFSAYSALWNHKCRVTSKWKWSVFMHKITQSYLIQSNIDWWMVYLRFPVGQG